MAFVGGHMPLRPTLSSPSSSQTLSSQTCKRMTTRGAFIRKQSIQVRTNKKTKNESNIIQAQQQGNEGGPPINAPSSVLLLTASVLAISTVGCVFELTGGHPTYGQTLTSGILAISLPGFLFFFYAAIRKGQQEAMDDP